MAAPGPHAQDVAFEARLPELRAGGAVDGVAREANFRARARARALSQRPRAARRAGSRGAGGRLTSAKAPPARDVTTLIQWSSAWPANACAGGVRRRRGRARSRAGRRGEIRAARAKRGGVRRSGCRPCPRPGLRCWAPAPPGRCSRSSRRAPRSCGCSRPSPWSSAPRLRRRRPPPQIVLRSAIFLIRKGAWRPPAGSAARARPGRARGPWGRQYYVIPSRWRRRGPVDARTRAAAPNPLHGSIAATDVRRARKQTMHYSRGSGSPPSRPAARARTCPSPSSSPRPWRI